MLQFVTLTSLIVQYGYTPQRPFASSVCPHLSHYVRNFSQVYCVRGTKRHIAMVEISRMNALYLSTMCD